MATAAVAKRIPVEEPSEANTVDAAAGIVADIEVRLAQARKAGEQIATRSAAVAFDAARGDGDAVKRSGRSARRPARVRAEISDLDCRLNRGSRALGGAERRSTLPPMRRRSTTPARSLQNSSSNRELIDRRVAEIVAAHGERRRLAAAILQTGCLHPARHPAFDCPTRMHHALSVSGATFLAPGQPPASGVVFAIYSLALADRETLAALSLANRNSRSTF